MHYQEFIKKYPFLFTNEDAPLKIITNPTEINEWQLQKRKELIQGNKPVEYSEIGIVLSDPYIIVLRDLVEFPNKERNGYFRLLLRGDLLGGQSVAVLPIMNEKILLLKHYRHTTRSWHLEIPRGFGEENIPDRDNAEKELFEETGAEINQLIELGLLHTDTGVERHSVSLYFAKIIQVGKPCKDEGIQDFRWVTISEFEDMIQSGLITDSFTMAAYVRAKLRGLLD